MFPSLIFSIIQKNNMYIFISIIFIAELIIAYQLISLIMKLDRKICDINDCVCEFNPLAHTFMRYIRIQAAAFSEKITKVINFINRQKEKTMIKVLIAISINAVILVFRVKKIKVRKVVRLAAAVADIAADLSLL